MRRWTTIVLLALVAASCGESTEVVAEGESAEVAEQTESVDQNEVEDSTEVGDAAERTIQPVLVVRHADNSVRALDVGLARGSTEIMQLLETVAELAPGADLSAVSDRDPSTSFFVFGGYSCGDGGRVVEVEPSRVTASVTAPLDCAVADPHLSIFQLEMADVELPFDLVSEEEGLDPTVVATIDSWSDEPTEAVGTVGGDLVGPTFSYVVGDTQEIPAAPVEAAAIEAETDCAPLAEAIAILLSEASTETSYDGDGWDLGVSVSALGAEDGQAVVGLMRDAGAECPAWTDLSSAAVGAVGQGNFILGTLLIDGQLTIVELENGSDGLGAERFAELIDLLTAD